MKARAAAEPIFERLSVRFLYEQMREIGSNLGFAESHPKEWRQGFTSLDAARKVLKDIGICSERAWPDTGYLLERPDDIARKDAADRKFNDSKYEICATQERRQQVHPASPHYS
jgi:hypothetical protein